MKLTVDLAISENKQDYHQDVWSQHDYLKEERAKTVAKSHQEEPRQKAERLFRECDLIGDQEGAMRQMLIMREENPKDSEVCLQMARFALKYGRFTYAE